MGTLNMHVVKCRTITNLMAWWLQCRPYDNEVVGSTPGRVAIK